MRTIVCLAFVAALAVVAYGENCRQPSDCQHVSCPENDYMVDCARGECTCTHNIDKCGKINCVRCSPFRVKATKTCSNQMDCTNIPNCPANREHCIDERCRCGFGIFGGGNN